MKLIGNMRHFLVVIFTLFITNLIAQKQKIMISGYMPLSIDFPIVGNQSFTSIGTVYNISPDTLSEFNNIDFYESPLRAKSIKIPLTVENFDQVGNPGNDEALVPVYFLATYTQSLQQITTKVNRVPISSLKKWNPEAGDMIEKGTTLIVGYLKAKTDQLAYFEDTVSVQFAHIDVKPASRITLPNKNTAQNTKVSTAKLPAIIKTDTTTIARTNPRKEEPKIPAIKPKVNSDSIKNVALNNTVTNSSRTNTNSPNRTVKVDSATLVKNTPKPAVKKEPIRKTAIDTAVRNTNNSRPNNTVVNNKRKDSVAIAKTPIVNSKPVIEVKKPSNKDSIALAGNNRTKTQVPVRTKQPIKNVPKVEDKKTDVAKLPDTKIESPKTTTETVVNRTVEKKPEPVTNNNVKADVTPAAINTSSANIRNNFEEYKALLIGQAFESMFNVDAPEKIKKELAGNASFFDSRTGWNDKKFYVLIPGVPVGTIVKITSKDSKAVYAKVLGNMPDMKENNGILLRLSNAAISALGINNSTFPVTVTYY